LRDKEGDDGVRGRGSRGRGGGKGRGRGDKRGGNGAWWRGERGKESGGLEKKEKGRGEEKRKENAGGVGDRKGRKGERRAVKGLGIAFWNVAGLGNKDRKFWESLKKWDVVTLVETWTEEKGWEKVKERLPGGFVWRTQGVKRKKKKGRAIGGLVMGIRKEWWIREEGGERGEGRYNGGES